MKSKTVAIHGAGGRMGRRLVALAGDAGLAVVEAVEHDGHPELGRDAGELAGLESLGVPLGKTLGTDAGVVIDFSLPDGTRRVIEHCRSAGLPMVIGTTGLTDDDQKQIDTAASEIAVCQATNFSLVVNVLWKLAAEAAQLLGEGYDIEVLEAHHRYKKDAPSGTARTLAQRLCDATGRDFARDVVFARYGEDAPRQPKDITVQTLRLGDHAGEHTAFFATPGERLEIKHVSTSRDSYAVGALRAAAWLVDQPAGRYDMADVLGL
ncbi:MAG: 4-hydroxy-tetrahydrodipicolinate reductase [Planctomycetota bacterium]